MIEFSFIIPVYNAEKCINRCLNSILQQNIDNYEVILIDDGSTDKSYTICQEYQKKDSRFKVYHQQNSGPSVARNKGLDVASGKWICFLDSDDFITQDYLQKIKQVSDNNEPEVIFLGYNQLNEKGDVVKINVPIINSGDKFETILALSEQDMFGYTWIKVFKRDLIGDIRFPVGMNLFEDEVFTCKIIKKCQHIKLLEYPVYNYVTGLGDSLIGRVHNDYCKKCDYVFLAWESLLEDYKDRECVLQNKAKQFVERCRYYGYERKVPFKEFFYDLANTHFFSVHRLQSKFDKYVYKCKINRIWLEKIKYTMKIRLSQLLGGKTDE